MLVVDVPEAREDLLLPLMQGIEGPKVSSQLLVGGDSEVHLPDTAIVAQERKHWRCELNPRLKRSARERQSTALGAAGGPYATRVHLGHAHDDRCKLGGIEKYLPIEQLFGPMLEPTNYMSSQRVPGYTSSILGESALPAAIQRCHRKPLANEIELVTPVASVSRVAVELQHGRDSPLDEAGPQELCVDARAADPGEKEVVALGKGGFQGIGPKLDLRVYRPHLCEPALPERINVVRARIAPLVLAELIERHVDNWHRTVSLSGRSEGALPANIRLAMPGKGAQPFRQTVTRSPAVFLPVIPKWSRYMTIAHEPYDLRALAARAVREAGFEPTFSPEALAEADRAAQSPPPSTSDTPGAEPLEALEWSSIDNPESRDLDQIEAAEEIAGGSIRLRIGIADVDAMAPAGSPIDMHASQNTTSVYAGVATFPMLPDALSAGATSLLENQVRLAVVTQIDVDRSGHTHNTRIFRAIVRNQARLNYEDVSEWLENRTPAAASPEVEAQLNLQWEAAKRILARRKLEGALDFERSDPVPVIRDGTVVDVRAESRGSARLLIENLMIAANTALADYLHSNGAPTIQRVVAAPARWPRIREIASAQGDHLPTEPDSKALAGFLERQLRSNPHEFGELSLAVMKLMGPGSYRVVMPGESQVHFALGADRYTHSTAPNRRFPDLVIQRQVKAILAGDSPPYSASELAEIAARCTERESAARKVERRLRKSAVASLFAHRIGEVFDAIVTGASERGCYVRALKPVVEGRVVSGAHGLDVGDRVRVRLVFTDIEQGFIDFERAS